jgi:hypothetical protein
MKMFKKGPSIKRPELKVPDFLLDLFYDLRDRHLLPLVGILIVGIVAVPIALGQSGGSEESGEAAAEGSFATPSSAPGQTGELVAKSAPGLRDYRRRLRRLRAKDPFKQQYTGASEEPASTAATASEGVSGTAATAIPSETPAGSTSPPEAEAEPTPGPGNLTYYSYAVDVRVVAGGSPKAAGSSGNGESDVRRNLPELTMLPSRETPAAIYMGSSRDGKKALMLISSNVEAIFGDGKCLLGSKTCELLAMEPGLPETFVYGGEGRTFKIEVLKIHPVATDELNRAPLGKPKQHKGGGQGSG